MSLSHCMQQFIYRPAFACNAMVHFAQCFYVVSLKSWTRQHKQLTAKLMHFCKSFGHDYFHSSFTGSTSIWWSSEVCTMPLLWLAQLLWANQSKQLQLYVCTNLRNDCFQLTWTPSFTKKSVQEVLKINTNVLTLSHDVLDSGTDSILSKLKHQKLWNRKRTIKPELHTMKQTKTAKRNNKHNY